MPPLATLERAEWTRRAGTRWCASTPTACRLAYRLSGNRLDAEDLTQETFVRVFRHAFGQAPGLAAPNTTNLFLDMVRRRRG
jgi:DNA-directed RNA polymerase specialized sigma24 family protein